MATALPRKRKSPGEDRDEVHASKRKKESSSSKRPPKKKKKKEEPRKSGSLRVRSVSELAKLVSTGAISLPKSLTHYAEDRVQLLDQVFTILSPSDVRGMLPDILKELKTKRVKQLCYEQLKHMTTDEIHKAINPEKAGVSSGGNLSSVLNELLDSATDKAGAGLSGGVREELEESAGEEGMEKDMSTSPVDKGGRGSDSSVEEIVIRVSDVSEDDSGSASGKGKKEKGSVLEPDPFLSQSSLPRRGSGGEQQAADHKRLLVVPLKPSSPPGSTQDTDHKPCSQEGATSIEESNTSEGDGTSGRESQPVLVADASFCVTSVPILEKAQQSNKVTVTGSKLGRWSRRKTGERRTGSRVKIRRKMVAKAPTLSETGHLDPPQQVDPPTSDVPTGERDIERGKKDVETGKNGVEAEKKDGGTGKNGVEAGKKDGGTGKNGVEAGKKDGGTGEKGVEAGKKDGGTGKDKATALMELKLREKALKSLLAKRKQQLIRSGQKLMTH